MSCNVSLLGVCVPVWVKPGTLSLPKNNQTPLIMIGPGTARFSLLSRISSRSQYSHLTPNKTSCTSSHYMRRAFLNYCRREESMIKLFFTFFSSQSSWKRSILQVKECWSVLFVRKCDVSKCSSSFNLYLVS